VTHKSSGEYVEHYNSHRSQRFLGQRPPSTLELTPDAIDEPTERSSRHSAGCSLSPVAMLSGHPGDSDAVASVYGPERETRVGLDPDTAVALAAPSQIATSRLRSLAHLPM
jgi:hypothetical protein